MRRLNSLALIPTSKSLDYGCGRGNDAELLGMDRYDPYYFPQATAPEYDVVTCNYVLNVLESKNERTQVITQLKGKTRLGGVIYVSVRNDIRNLNGLTSKGTWQGEIKDAELEAQGFEKIHATVLYRLFKYEKPNKQITIK